MIQFDLPKEKSSIIKVIGIGGGGSNAVNYMYSLGIEGVNFIICNTDAQSIAHSKVPNKIQLGPHLTQGLGAGANPEIGRQATEESLEEIRRILEVNTKMAFITAGMGGGTGTGGAPIISKICKDLGILTVGIVTTPFTYEGKKRMLQAEDGIRNLKNYVDTLLIISNDKLRHQFGNLKMKEAFGRADNVLATAAKCITDVINTTGQINVDFADVCTVMRNGGVAILGSATASGMNRAQQAIEEALNSPLLNDTDVRGAKWILININSAEGEHEYTMDEVEVIQQYLLSRTGADTDLILGMGYDHQLGDRIGITLIATGFEQKNPFNKEAAVSKVANPEEKIMMTLEMNKVTAEEVIPAGNEHAKVLVEMSEDKLEEVPERSMAPRLLQTEDASAGNGPIFFDLDISSGKPVDKKVEKNEENGKIEWVLSLPSVSGNFSSEPSGPSGNKNTDQSNSSSSAASGGYLAKPANIYAETETKKSAPAHEPLKGVVGEGTAKNPKDEEPSPEDMQLIIKDAPTAADEPRAHQTLTSVTASDSVEEPAPQDETEELKRRAAERMQKLRNLSFNVNAADPNNEFETVPAYIRRNLDLYNTYSSVENFYSNYEVRKDDDQSARISTLNSFLDGKKPD